MGMNLDMGMVITSSLKPDHEAVKLSSKLRGGAMVPFLKSIGRGTTPFSKLIGGVTLSSLKPEGGASPATSATQLSTETSFDH